jgi:hypothetical protein
VVQERDGLVELELSRPRTADGRVNGAQGVAIVLLDLAVPLGRCGFQRGGNDTSSKG